MTPPRITPRIKSSNTCQPIRNATREGMVVIAAIIVPLTIISNIESLGF